MTEQERLYITAKDLLESDVKPPDWLVDKIISEGGTTMIVGTYKSSKTLFALYLAVCVSTGKPIFNKYSTKSGRVL